MTDRLIRSAMRTGLLACAAVLTACAQLATPHVDVVEAPQRPAPSAAIAAAAPAPVPASAGAIFQGAAYQPLFENVRARTVGDLLTVTIQENTTARQSSNMSLNRDGKVDGAITAIPFVKAPSWLSRAKVGGSMGNDTTSKGESGSDNVFNGTITATVVEVLPNGNFVIVGEKQVGVNQTIDSLRFSGVVDPRSIRPGNTIASTQIADVRLQFSGRGDIDRAMTTGWLQKFFFNYAPM
jgi:flagellar L-ring protein precursor FlgH